MVRTQIQLTEAQAKALKKLASSRHLSVAELVRQAVNNITRSGGVIDFEERRKRALAAVGRFSSGKRDVSIKHDKYFAESILPKK
jgi:hypothetical protein